MTPHPPHHLLRYSEVYWDIVRYTEFCCDMLRYAATYCDILQYTAIYWDMLWHAEICCDIMRYTIYCNILRCTERATELLKLPWIQRRFCSGSPSWAVWGRWVGRCGPSRHCSGQVRCLGEASCTVLSLLTPVWCVEVWRWGCEGVLEVKWKGNIIVNKIGSYMQPKIRTWISFITCIPPNDILEN